MKDEYNPMDEARSFYNHKTNGFHINFANGNSLSTIWGRGTYSDNKLRELEPLERVGSDTCEVRPGCSTEVKEELDKMFPDNAGDSVYPYVTLEQWIDIVNYLNNHQ